MLSSVKSDDGDDEKELWEPSESQLTHSVVGSLPVPSSSSSDHGAPDFDTLTIQDISKFIRNNSMIELRPHTPSVSSGGRSHSAKKKRKKKGAEETIWQKMYTHRRRIVASILLIGEIVCIIGILVLANSKGTDGEDLDQYKAGLVYIIVGYAILWPTLLQQWCGGGKYRTPAQVAFFVQVIMFIIVFFREQIGVKPNAQNTCHVISCAALIPMALLVILEPEMPACLKWCETQHVRRRRVRPRKTTPSKSAKSSSKSKRSKQSKPDLSTDRSDHREAL